MRARRFGAIGSLALPRPVFEPAGIAKFFPGASGSNASPRAVGKRT